MARMLHPGFQEPFSPRAFVTVSSLGNGLETLKKELVEKVLIAPQKDIPQSPPNSLWPDLADAAQPSDPDLRLFLAPCRGQVTPGPAHPALPLAMGVTDMSGRTHCRTCAVPGLSKRERVFQELVNIY